MPEIEKQAREWLEREVCYPNTRRNMAWGLPANLGAERVIKLLAKFAIYREKSHACAKEATDAGE